MAEEVRRIAHVGHLRVISVVMGSESGTKSDRNAEVRNLAIEQLDSASLQTTQCQAEIDLTARGRLTLRLNRPGALSAATYDRCDPISLLVQPPV